MYATELDAVAHSEDESELEDHVREERLRDKNGDSGEKGESLQNANAVKKSIWDLEDQNDFMADLMPDNSLKSLMPANSRQYRSVGRN